MKRFAFTISVVVFLHISATVLYSQDTLRENRSFRNCITLDLGRILWNEARIGYERRISDRRAYRVSAGIQYPTSESFRNLSYTFGEGYEPFYNWVSTGIYIGTGVNFFYKEGSSNYISFEGYYNYAFYNHKYFYYDGYRDDIESLESMRQHKTGIRIVSVLTSQDVSIGNAPFEIGVFAGIGVQYRHRNVFKEDILTTGYDWPPFDPPRKETHENVYPTLHVGVLFGVPFGRREGL